MLHVCSSFLKRGPVRTISPFLTVVSSFPGTVRQVYPITAAAKACHDEKKAVTVSDGVSLLRTAGQGQVVEVAHHISPEDKMTRLRPSKTGLSMHINISAIQPLTPPCIYVSRTTKKELPDLRDMFCASIPADPYYEPIVHGDPGDITASDLQKVFDFIISNRETLLVFWYQLDGCESYWDDLKGIC